LLAKELLLFELLLLFVLYRKFAILKDVKTNKYLSNKNNVIEQYF